MSKHRTRNGFRWYSGRAGTHAYRATDIPRDPDFSVCGIERRPMDRPVNPGKGAPYLCRPCARAAFPR